ncbi:hypothetical protein [Pseudovibrio exalbescens]|uniref:Uncharacterized protein n=1 Tax=Pseudovibrio exalbescens TaxID=197461 RepID=A0A1U7JCX3_9HYPH|nr:hypothetical protein [Pseudovibrio exalbescens]OKL42548.1 hypothetical protein A3843_17970 [Pseudovibrio exalbescens]
MFKNTLMALAVAVGLGTGVEAQAQFLPQGYSFSVDDYGLQLRFKGRTVFEAGREPWDPVFGVQGPEDLTQNGQPNLAILERTARSRAKFTLLELTDDGVKVLFEVDARPEALEVFRNLTPKMAQDLAAGSGPRPDDGLMPFPQDIGRESAKITRPEPKAADQEALPLSNGHWAYEPGSWDEGFAAKLGWKDPDLSPNTFTFIKFRCPDNGDDIWVEPMMMHETQEEVPDQLVFEMDGDPFKLRLQWQYDDGMAAWVGMGFVPTDTQLFAKMQAARQIVMRYGDYDPYELTGGAADPEQEMAIEMFATRCIR